MSTLDELQNRVTELEKQFEDTLFKYHFSSRWEWFRAVEYGNPTPKALDSVWMSYIQALHKFYLRRDGPYGFLDRDWETDT